MENSNGPKTDPCGTPQLKFTTEEKMGSEARLFFFGFFGFLKILLLFIKDISFDTMIFPKTLKQKGNLEICL